MDLPPMGERNPWLVVADHPETVGRIDGRPGPGEVGTRDAGDVENAEDHRRRSAGGV